MEKVLVIGLGVSGKSAAEFLFSLGYQVFGFEENKEKIPSFVSPVSLEEMSFLAECSFVVLSPGISQNHVFCEKAKSLAIEVIGEAELAFRYLHKNFPKQRCIAITGTNGKTTITLLIEHILKQAGKKSKALGNVGTPLTACVQNLDPEEILVCELSSYQLETMTVPVFSEGIIANITPDHLDRYPSLEEYARAKVRLQKCMKEEGTLFVYENCLKDFPKLFQGFSFKTYGFSSNADFFTDKKYFYQKEETIFSLPSSFEKIGIHESENALAAWCAISGIGISSQEFLRGLETFTKPSHRIEFVQTLSGVDYYDDSKGTNVDAVIQAVKAMQKQIVLIAGGVDKGFPFTIWKESFMGKVKHVVSIGETASAIAKELGDEFPVTIASSLEDAVERASSIAKEGDCVLLSPGCSSFDMFRDYKHRGQEFKRCVASLENRRKKS